MKNFIASCIVVFLLSVSFVFSQDTKRPITVDDFFKMKTVRNPQISPGGKWIAYTVSEMDLKKDKSETRIWMVRADGTGEAIPMTSQGYSAGRPRWSPDGKYLSFMASRGKNEDGKPNKAQVWTLNLMGGEAQQITHTKFGVNGMNGRLMAIDCFYIFVIPSPKN